MTQNVKTAAFGYLSPDAARVFLEIKNYRVSIYTGQELPVLVEGQRNIVLVPNYRTRDGLASIASGIHRLLVYPGREDLSKLAELGIPILDAQENEDGDWVQIFPTQTPSEYINRIEAEAVEIELDATVAAQKPKAEPLPDPDAAKSLKEWLDVLDKFLPAVIENFDAEVEFPVCQFLIGEAGAADFLNAMKALVARGADEVLIKSFYIWTRNNEAKLGPAIKELLFSAEPEPPAVRIVAARHKVPDADVSLVESVYYAMKEDQNDPHG